MILANSHTNVRFFKPFNSSIVQIPYAFCTERSRQVLIRWSTCSLVHSAGAPFGRLKCDQAVKFQNNECHSELERHLFHPKSNHFQEGLRDRDRVILAKEYSRNVMIKHFTLSSQSKAKTRTVDSCKSHSRHRHYRGECTHTD